MSWCARPRERVPPTIWIVPARSCGTRSRPGRCRVRSSRRWPGAIGPGCERIENVLGAGERLAGVDVGDPTRGQKLGSTKTSVTPRARAARRGRRGSDRACRAAAVAAREARTRGGRRGRERRSARRPGRARPRVPRRAPCRCSRQGLRGRGGSCSRSSPVRAVRHAVVPGSPCRRAAPAGAAAARAPDRRANAAPCRTRRRTRPDPVSTVPAGSGRTRPCARHAARRAPRRRRTPGAASRCRARR